MQNTLGMRLCVQQRQRRTPRSTKDDPLVDAEPLSDYLYVVDQMLCRIVHNVRMGPRPSASALIEQDHAVDVRPEKAAHPGAATATRTAVQYDHGNAVGLAALLHIQAVTALHLDRVETIGLAGGI